MRLLGICVLALLLRAASGAEPAVEIEFEYSPSWHDETLVYLARLPDGKIHCEVLTRPELGSTSERKWKRIKEVDVSPENFAQLERGFENPELRRAAELDWIAMPDGSRWRLKKKKGAMSVEIVAHNPESKAEGVPIVSLGRAFSTAASAGLFAK